LKEVQDYPYTISYVVRKRLQIDNLNELPKEKRPPFKILFYGTNEDLDDWLETVMNAKHQDTIEIREDEIEG
jgi:hypothetical protein